jgi:hypothetical protein
VPSASADSFRNIQTTPRKNILFFLRSRFVALDPTNPQESGVFRG